MSMFVMITGTIEVGKNAHRYKYTIPRIPNSTIKVFLNPITFAFVPSPNTSAVIKICCTFSIVFIVSLENPWAISS